MSPALDSLSLRWLTRTCHKQLSHLTGSYSEDGAADWMRTFAPDLLVENDNTEAPFAMVT